MTAETGIGRIELKNGIVIRDDPHHPGYYRIEDPGTPNCAAMVSSIRECLECVEWLLACRLWPDQWEGPTYKVLHAEQAD